MITKTSCAKLLILFSLATCLTGCFEAVNFNDKPMYPHAITPRSTWTVKGVGTGCKFNDLNAILDGNNNTYMSTSGDYENASLIFDLKRICRFNAITVFHGTGRKELGHAGVINVYVSDDGKNFKFIKSFPGTRKYTYFTLLTPVKGRYLKLEAARSGRYPWTISNILIQ